MIITIKIYKILRNIKISIAFFKWIPSNFQLVSAAREFINDDLSLVVALAGERFASVFIMSISYPPLCVNSRIIS